MPVEIGEIKVDYPYVIVSGITGFNQETMLAISAKLLEMYKSSGEHDDITNEKGGVTRNLITPYDVHFYSLSHIAEKAAEVLRYHGNKTVESIYSFVLTPISLPKKGDTHEVPKNSLIFSTHPSFDKIGKRSNKKQTVVVNNVSRGHYNDYHANDGVGWNPAEITWAGTGGYWKWYKPGIDNVEIS